MSGHKWHWPDGKGGLLCRCGAKLGLIEKTDLLRELAAPTRCPLADAASHPRGPRVGDTLDLSGVPEAGEPGTEDPALSEEFSLDVREEDKAPKEEQKSTPEIMFGLRVIQLGQRVESLEKRYEADVGDRVEAVAESLKANRIHLEVLLAWMKKVRS